MTAGDVITCAVTALAYGGDGVARHDGQVVFIPETAPGDVVQARITLVKKNFARAALLDLVQGSDLRAEPCCRIEDPSSGALCRVPGCVYDHLAYPAELAAKAGQLAGFLRRLPGKPDRVMLPPVESPRTLHYRNKIVLHVSRDGGSARAGYLQEPAHRVLDLPSCPLARAPINAALAELRRSRQFADAPDGATVTFRHTELDGAVWWLKRGTAEEASGASLTESSPVGPLRVPRDGFYQVNPEVGDRLVRTAAAWFADGPACPEILDLYCGVGVFGFALLKQGGTRLVGVESGRQAVATARINARSLGLSATFHCHAIGRPALPLRDLLQAPEATTAVVDPPRDGLSPDLVRALAGSGIARLLYVSCDPATLTRDAAALLGSGHYRIVRAQLFDMFPRTAHFESLVELACTSRTPASGLKT